MKRKRTEPLNMKKKPFFMETKTEHPKRNKKITSPSKIAFELPKSLTVRGIFYFDLEWIKAMF